MAINKRQKELNQYRASLEGVPLFSQLAMEREFMLKILDRVYVQTVTLYVDAATGDDSFPGTLAAKPKLTIQGAIDALPADFSEAYVVIAAGTYAENVVIVKPTTGTIYLIGTAGITATDALGAACYNGTSGTVSGWDQITMAGMFTVANATETSFIRVTHAAGYEFARILGRVSDDVAEIGHTLPAGVLAADYDTLAISLMVPSVIINSVTGNAITIYDAPGGSKGSVVMGMITTVGTDLGLSVVGKTDGIYAHLCNLTSDGNTSKALYMNDDCEINLGYSAAYDATFLALMGVGVQAALPREGCYLEGGAAGDSVIMRAGRLRLGDTYFHSPCEFVGGEVVLMHNGQNFEDTVLMMGDVFVDVSDLAIPTRFEATVSARQFAKSLFGIFDGQIDAAGSQLRVYDDSNTRIAGVSGINQSHASAWLRMSENAQVTIDGIMTASALAATTAITMEDRAKLYLTDIRGPTQDYGAVPLILAEGPGVYLKITAGAWTNNNGGGGGAQHAVEILRGAFYHIVDQSDVAFPAGDGNKYVQIGSLGAATDITGFGAGTYQNDLPVAPAGTEHMSNLFVEAA